MTHRTAKSIAALGISAAAGATILALLEYAGLIADVASGRQGALVTIMLGLAITLLGVSWMHFSAPADTGTGAVQAAFRAGVDYGTLRRRPAEARRMDDAA